MNTHYLYRVYLLKALLINLWHKLLFVAVKQEKRNENDKKKLNQRKRENRKSKKGETQKERKEGRE